MAWVAPLRAATILNHDPPCDEQRNEYPHPDAHKITIVDIIFPCPGVIHRAKQPHPVCQAGKSRLCRLNVVNHILQGLEQRLVIKLFPVNLLIYLSLPIDKSRLRYMIEPANGGRKKYKPQILAQLFYSVCVSTNEFPVSHFHIHTFAKIIHRLWRIVLRIETDRQHPEAVNS